MASPSTVAVTALIEFDWVLSLGDAIVGFGTLTLAAVTMWLAWQSRREVQVSAQSIDLTREGIEAQDMPFVIAVPEPEQVRSLDATKNSSWMWWSWQGEDDVYSLQARLWNIGKGPAIVRDVRLQVGEEDVLKVRSGRFGEIVIAPGAVYDTSLGLESSKPPDEERLGLLRVYFAHSSGSEHLTRSDAYVGPSGVHCSNYARQVCDGGGRRLGQ